jgi:hypothetical protein
MGWDSLTSKDMLMVLIVVGILVLGKFVSLLVDTGYHRLTDNTAITKVDCTICKALLNENIRIVKMLLLVVAVKVGVDEDQLKELIGK